MAIEGSNEHVNDGDEKSLHPLPLSDKAQIHQQVLPQKPI